jgi:hypothetical protein
VKAAFLLQFRGWLRKQHLLESAMQHTFMYLRFALHLIDLL